MGILLRCHWHATEILEVVYHNFMSPLHPYVIFQSLYACYVCVCVNAYASERVQVQLVSVDWEDEKKAVTHKHNWLKNIKRISQTLLC